MRMLSAVAVSIVLLGGAALAEEAPAKREEPAKSVAQSAASAAAKLGSGFRTWFQHLKEGLSESSVSGDRQHGRLSAVAAVRGAKQDGADPAKPEWKSGAKSKKERLRRQEKAEFSSAVDSILDGKLQEGAEKLDAFEKAHPSSALMPEVRQAREKLQEAQAEPQPQP